MLAKCLTDLVGEKKIVEADLRQLVSDLAPRKDELSDAVTVIQGEFSKNMDPASKKLNDLCDALLAHAAHDRNLPFNYKVALSDVDIENLGTLTDNVCLAMEQIEEDTHDSLAAMADIMLELRALDSMSGTARTRRASALASLVDAFEALDPQVQRTLQMIRLARRRVAENVAAAMEDLEKLREMQNEAKAELDV
jgi:hypothetical protein